MNPILHLLTGTERGGCEVNALNLVRASPQLRHVLLVLGTAGPMSPEFEAAGVEVRHAGVLGSGLRPVIGSVEKAVRDWEPAGIIAWHGMVVLPEILHALRDYQGKVLVHGGNPAHSMPRRVDWRYLLLEKWLGRRGEATYVCCSQFVADSFRSSRYLRRFPVRVVPNGVQCPGLPAPEPVALDTGSPVTIGMTARLDAIKDHATLLRAFAIVFEQYPFASLELLGDGDLRSSLEALAGSLGIRERVNFRGMVEEVYSEMTHWDLFVYSTTDREGLGNALIEAMMLGLPCVVTDAGPMGELAGDPPGALLVASGNPKAMAAEIIRVLGDYNLRKSFARAGRRRAEEGYSPSRFACGYLDEIGIPGWIFSSSPHLGQSAPD